MRVKTLRLDREALVDLRTDELTRIVGGVTPGCTTTATDTVSRTATATATETLTQTTTGGIGVFELPGGTTSC